LQSKSCTNAKDEPIPWFTYPAIEYISQLNLTEKNVLEWGSGNSSLFFSKISNSVTSIEDNMEWYKRVSLNKGANHEVIHAEADNYAGLPLSLERKFDIVVIDGIRRDECAKVALEVLAEGGIIIYDNSDRDPEVCHFLRSADLIQVDMHGFGPINDYTWTTSYFFTRNFNFQPIGNQPLIPVGGGY
jgi:protein-L-isoaspartate O-methyltransferase